MGKDSQSFSESKVVRWKEVDWVDELVTGLDLQGVRMTDQNIDDMKVKFNPIVRESK